MGQSENQNGVNIFKTTKKYKIILSDPPWHYKHWNDETVKRKCKYSLMEKEDIWKLPVKDIADENAVLFIWVTFPKLLDGLETIKRWGFEYKTIGFNWVKQNKKSNSLFWGLGYYTRSNSELCLLATKGNILKRINKDVHSVILSPIQEHSKKPNEVRNRIVKLFGDLPRIELFARPPKDRLFEDESYEGWDLWGNEV